MNIICLFYSILVVHRVYSNQMPILLLKAQMKRQWAIFGV